MRLRSIYPLLLLLLLGAGTASALSLEEAALIGHQRSLAMEDPRIERVRIGGRITEAWSNALPQIDGTAAYQRTWKSPVIFFPDFMNPGQFAKYEVQQNNSAIGEVALNQPIYTFGRIGAGLRAAYAGRRSNEHFTTSTTHTVELEVMRRYWTVLLMRDVLEARHSSLAISDSSLLRMQRMRDVGLASDYDVLRMQVQAANQVPQVRQAENSLRLAELALKEQLGLPLDTTVTAEGSLESYARISDFDTLDISVLDRPDLEGLRDLAALQQNLYTVQKSMRWPVLAGQLKYQWQWSNDEWDINPRNNASSVYGGLALTIPIWSSGRVYGRAQQAKADWQQAQLALARAERGAQLQYESAVRSYRAAIASEEAARVALEHATEARRIAQTRLEQGQITPLEIDAAQLGELIARVSLAQAFYDRLVAAAEARLAVGRSPYSK